MGSVHGLINTCSSIDPYDGKDEDAASDIKSINRVHQSIETLVCGHIKPDLSLVVHLRAATCVNLISN
jgi:hypothetical protein